MHPAEKDAARVPPGTPTNWQRTGSIQVRMTWTRDPIRSSSAVLRRSQHSIESSRVWAREMREILERTMVLISETCDLIQRSDEAAQALKKIGEDCTDLSSPEG
jgi:hypothetical protein